MNKEQIFAIGFHVWCMKIGFLGFNKADYNQKIDEYKKFLKSIPVRPVVNSDPFFNIGLDQRQKEYDNKYNIFINGKD